MANKLFIVGLPVFSTTESISEYFGQYGNVIEAQITARHAAGQNAFVRFEDPELASQIAATAGHIVDGAEIQLNASPTVGESRTLGGPGPSKSCRHFAAGRCTFGAACTFRHDGAPPGQMPFLGEMDTPAGFARAVPSGGKTTPCRHFLMGKCTYGDACTFSHGPAPGAPMITPGGSSATCRHFLEGKCSYGDQCKFGHGFPAPAAYFAPSSVFHFAAPAPIQESRPVCRHFQQGKCSYGNACTFSHGMPQPAFQAPQMMRSAAPGDAPMCRHFLEGKCNFSDTCRFSHGFVAPQQAFFAPAPQQVSAGGSSAVCRHFLEGKCNYGAECKYSHAAFGPAKGVQHRAPRPSSGGAADLKTETCRHYLLGRCNMGETCRFRHDGDTSEQEMADILAELNGGATLDGFVQKDAGPCRHFLAGKCNFGDGCRFTHDAGMEKGGKGSKGRSSPY
mmetsp:Transcript_45640/g.74115  ORF Transcript_45640/g.74115 Transcript_45640/m.74115 type:complete len:449 (-) Transcript_45640:23-1369(-)